MEISICFFGKIDKEKKGKKTGTLGARFGLGIKLQHYFQFP